MPSYTITAAQPKVVTLPGRYSYKITAGVGVLRPTNFIAAVGVPVMVRFTRSGGVLRAQTPAEWTVIALGTPAVTECGKVSL